MQQAQQERQLAARTDARNEHLRQADALRCRHPVHRPVHNIQKQARQ